VSAELEKMTPRELWLGVFKIAITLSVGLLIAAFALSLVFSLEGGRLSGIAINALLIAVAISFLANGVMAILKIFNWFEARRAKGGDR
jgi:hypothetical protein